jgi:hypothetical protein
MKSSLKPVLIALTFVVLAGLLRFWIAPFFELLPVDYANETKLLDEVQFRDSPNGEWQASTQDVRRMDQTISNSGQTAIIEGTVQAYDATGAVNFEVTGLYGVDRRTRQNLTGYGDLNRTGQYLFPPHVQPIEYPIWDPIFIGMRQASFERIEKVDGLQLYVFSFYGTGMDESAGYSYLPDVPEHYLAYTDGQGVIWVEPLSGIVVDYKDTGVSYFVDPTTGTRLADFNLWEERFTPETRATQLKLARSARLRTLLLEFWFPAFFLAASMIWLAIGLIRRKP